MHTCDGFKLLLSEEDYAEKLERIEDVSRMDLVGRSVSDAVKLSTVKPKTRRVLRTRPIPKLRIADVLRQRDFRTGNISKAMCGIFEKYGSVVRVPFKMGGQPVVALMGPEANHWVNRHGRFYLRAKDYIHDFEREFGASPNAARHGRRRAPQDAKVAAQCLFPCGARAKVARADFPLAGNRSVSGTKAIFSERRKPFRTT